MTISNNFAINSLAMQQVMATHFHANTTSQASTAFTQSCAGIDKNVTSFQVQKSSTMQIGFVATQFQAQNAISSVNRTNNASSNWCISDHYKVPLEEVVPALRKLEAELKAFNFSGMTDIEIYDYVESRYIEVFGEDFRMAYHLGVDDPKSNCPNFNSLSYNMVNNLIRTGGYDSNTGKLLDSANFRSIFNSFNSILRDHFSEYVGGYDRTRDINRERLYGDLDKFEIMDAIRAKYPESLTYRDLALMTSEMYDVGLTSFAMRGYGDFCDEYNPDGSRKQTQNEFNESVIRKLDLPVDVSSILSGYNYAVQNLRAGETLSQASFDLRDFAIRYFGAVMDPNGLFLINEKVDIDLQNLKWDYTKMIPDLEEEFIETLNQHDSEVAKIREKNNTEYERKRVQAVYEDSSLTPRRKAGSLTSASEGVAS